MHYIFVTPQGHTYITLDAGITLAHVRPVPVSLPTHPYTHQTNTVEMINSTFEVTFGIEVECILAFHETLLRNHLATTTTANPKIIKTIPDDTRRKLNQVSQHYLDEDTRHHDVSRQRYMGWALTTPTSYPPSRDNIGFQSQFDAHLSRHGYRAYGGEILQLAQTLLPTGVEVHDSFHTDKYTGDFSHWHLTHERGLVGVDKEELTKRLLRRANDEAGHILPDDNRRTCPVADEWDNHPLELVSRVLPYNAASLAEITAHITALRSGSKHFAFPTKHCGLHVHVGLPVPPNNSNMDLKSNLDNFLVEPEPLTDKEWDALDARVSAGEDPDVVYAQPSTHDTLEKTALAKIFSKDMTIEKLSTLMGGTDRYRIVNWTYLARTDGSPRTLEFRQHASTLCPLTITHWLSFVIGLVRLADFNARIYGSSGEGYEWRLKTDGAESVWELIEKGIGMEEEEVKWWKKRRENL